MSFSQGVIPIHKKGSTKDVNNYRPISLLSTCSKIFEKLIATRLNNFLELHSIIYPINDLVLDQVLQQLTH